MDDDMSIKTVVGALTSLSILIIAVCLSPPAHAQVSHSVTLTWTWTQTGGDPATAFTVGRSSVTGGPYTIIDTTPNATTFTYVDPNVSAGQTWYYIVTATNPGGDSVPSNEASCTIPFLAPSGTTKLSAVAK